MMTFSISPPLPVWCVWFERDARPLEDRSGMDGPFPAVGVFCDVPAVDEEDQEAFSEVQDLAIWWIVVIGSGWEILHVRPYDVFQSQEEARAALAWRREHWR
jgi:hypothetical protein